MWYMIDGFNGYEINESGDVRSMKMMWKNPGHLLKKDKYGCYTLSNNNNERVRISSQELLDIVFNSGKELVPRPDNAVYLGGRNKKFYYDEGVYHNPNSDKVKIDFSQFIVKE